METASLLDKAGFASFGTLTAQEIPLLPGKTLPEGVAGAIVGLFPYFTGAYPHRNVALYAVGHDYHMIVKAHLQRAAEALSERLPGLRCRAFVDASPIHEVEAARRAGLGYVGQNGLLIAPVWGQMVFIGCLLTNLPPEALGMVPSAPLPQNLCRGCGRCVAACPTGALTRQDMGRCRSAITQKKGMLTHWEAAQIAEGGFVWGCDICLMACPHNARPPLSPIAEFYENPLPRLTPSDIDGLCNRAYLWRGRDLLRRNLSLIDCTIKEATSHLQNT